MAEDPGAALLTTPARRLDEWAGHALARWVGAIQRRAGWVAIVSVVSAALALGLALDRLGVDSNEDALFSKTTEFAALRQDFRAAFPALVDPVVVVIDGATPEAAAEAASLLRSRLLRDPVRFPTVMQPGGGPFFERHALLYLDADELDEVLAHLIGLQPYIGRLARDGSLPAFFDLLGEAAEAAAAGDLAGTELSHGLTLVDRAVSAWHAGEPGGRLAWSELLLGRPADVRERRAVLLVEPVVDYDQLSPAESTLTGLRSAIVELGLDVRPELQVRLTGLFPLADEESRHVASQAGVAGAASFLLVTGVLGFGLRSRRLVGALIVTLLVGLAWTAAFAAVAVGHLNLISVTFAVLFIGLSVDFGVHFGLRWREELARGAANEVALRDAAHHVGGPLLVCTVSTAAAFYAFAPTAFLGMAELGVIAGTGMLISFFANMTVLPALLALGPQPQASAPLPPGRALGFLTAVPVRHPVAVGLVAALATAASLMMLPSLHFDGSPLRVRDPSMPSVRAFEDLLADGMAFPWNLHPLAPDAAAAEQLAEQLERLPTVREAVTLTDFVPSDQEEKLTAIEDAAFLLLPSLLQSALEPTPNTVDRSAAAASFVERLAHVEGSDKASPELRRSAGSLHATLASVLRDLEPGTAGPRLAELETALLAGLPEQLRRLRVSLEPAAVARSDLPPDLVSQWVAADGRFRIEVFPREDLHDGAALARYVRSVQQLAPDAFGEGLVIRESARIVTEAFQIALVLAAAFIALLVYGFWRDAAATAWVAMPLALAAVCTAGASAALGLPFNFANVIVIPLLLGMGVDSAVHLVARDRDEPPADGRLLATSTARAVVVSGLTTAASFGTLGLSSHLGMASLGRMLTLGIALILAANLLVLPAALAWRKRRGSRRG